jgi:hypothetical protein
MPETDTNRFEYDYLRAAGPIRRASWVRGGECVVQFDSEPEYVLHYHSSHAEALACNERDFASINDPQYITANDGPAIRVGPQEER